MMEKDAIPVKAGEVLEVKSTWLQEKEAEIQRGEEALVQLQRIEGVSKAKIARTKGRIRFIRKFVDLMKQGFIPIPRMDFDPIDQYTYPGPSWKMYLEPMPVQALATIAEYQDKFDHLGLVKPTSGGRKRDPFLIGIINYGNLEEHFLIGWWRPDLIKPCELW